MKYYLPLPFLITVATFAGCVSSKQSTEPVSLALNLEKQKTYTYNLKTHFDMDMEMMSQKVGTGLDMDYRYLLNLVSKDSLGNSVLRSTIGDLKFRAEVMGMGMGYDSQERVDTNNQDPMSSGIRRVFSAMLGKSFTVSLSRTGEIQNVAGLEDIVSVMAKNLPGDDSDKVGLKDKLNESFNQQQVRQAFGQVFNLYPDKPVKKGDSWQRDVALGLKGMSSKQSITYTFRDVTPYNVILSLKGDIRSADVHPQKDPTVKVPMMKGTEEGTMTIDRTTGLATAGNIDLKMKGEIEIQGKKAPVDIKGKITITNK